MNQALSAASALLTLFVVFSGCTEKHDIQPGKGRIEGIVTDTKSGEPIENAIALTYNPTRRTVSDENGRFSFVDVDTGQHAIAVRKPRYSPVKSWAGFPNFEVRPGSTTALTIELRKRKLDQLGVSSDFDDGFAKGRLLAEAEIDNFDFCMYTGGYDAGGRRSLDEATDLPRRPVRGCEVDDWWSGLIEGHNDRMWEHVCENGFPEVPRWWRFDNWSSVSWFCNEPFTDSSFVELSARGPGIVSADSCYTIQYEALWEENFPRYLFICGKGDTAITELPAIGFDTLRIIWGPDSSDIAFLVTDNLQLSLLDLKSGDLRQFRRSKNSRKVNAPVPKTRTPRPRDPQTTSP